MTEGGFLVELQAKDPAHNRWRFYRIEAGRNLFGDWAVRLTYGRIGSRGHTKTLTAPDAAGAAQLVRACLKRRKSAPKRIVVPYQVIEKFDPENWT